MAGRRHSWITALVALAVMLAGGRETAAAARAGDAPLAYRVRLAVDGPGELAAAIREASRLKSLESLPPASPAILARRIRADERTITRLLRAEGFYAGRVAISREAAAGAGPTTVTIAVTAGPRYLLRRITVTTPDGGAAVPVPSPADIGLAPGAPARAAVVRAAEDRLLAHYAAHGHPFARIADRRFIVDHAARAMDVAFAVDPGPAAVFGPVRFAGAETIARDWLGRFVPFRAGGPFDRRLVDRLRRRLVASGLFRQVNVETGEAVEGDGTPAAPLVLPVIVTLAPDRLRELALSARWSTSEGPAGEAVWTHHAVIGGRARLDLDLAASEIAQKAGATVTFRHLGRFDQNLSWGLALARDSTKAFDARSVETDLLLRRRRESGSELSAGLAFALSREEGDAVRNIWSLALPLAGILDRRDDRLDPHRGMLAGLRLGPTLVGGDDRAAFLRAEAEARGYLALGESVLAARLLLGGIPGADLDAIPFSRRFYLGGGGSLRGFGFQRAGPVDEAGRPVGGRGLLLVSVEPRIALTRSLGIVPFLDAGSLSRRPYPDPAAKLRASAGIGVFWRTAIGPLRIDAAFPVTDRANLPRRFQIYVGIGHGF